MTYKIAGIQTPDKYTPACTANCDECPLRVNDEDSGARVCWHWERVSDAICEMFLHDDRPVREM